MITSGRLLGAVVAADVAGRSPSRRLGVVPGAGARVHDGVVVAVAAHGPCRVHGGAARRVPLVGLPTRGTVGARAVQAVPATHKR